ncbi:MAG: serine protease [Lacipirellulaceae bacterium]
MALLAAIRRLRFVLIVAAFVVTAKTQAVGQSASHQSQRPHPAVARIIVPEGEATSFGSGTLVDLRDDYGLVITNWHVVRDAQGPIEVLFPDGYHSKARALKIDSDWDLAALVIWRPQAKPVRLAQQAPQPGDPLTICGYGHGIYRSATGRCTQYYAPDVNLPRHMVELDVQARQGDSGGPIFNEQGELAGVLFGAGQGTTLGSFGGRVGQFLATLAPDIGYGDDRSVGLAKLADASDAAANTNRSAKESSSLAKTKSAEPKYEKTASASLEPVTTEGADQTPAQLGETPWNTSDEKVAALWNRQQPAPSEANATQARPRIRRSGWFDEAKTLLAAIGVIAIVAQALRAAK